LGLTDTDRSKPILHLLLDAKASSARTFAHTASSPPAATSKFSSSTHHDTHQDYPSRDFKTMPPTAYDEDHYDFAPEKVSSAKSSPESKFGAKEHQREPVHAPEPEPEPELSHIPEDEYKIDADSEDESFERSDHKFNPESINSKPALAPITSSASSSASSSLSSLSSLPSTRPLGGLPALTGAGLNANRRAALDPLPGTSSPPQQQQASKDKYAKFHVNSDSDEDDDHYNVKKSPEQPAKASYASQSKQDSKHDDHDTEEDEEIEEIEEMPDDNDELEQSMERSGSSHEKRTATTHESKLDDLKADTQHVFSAATASLSSVPSRALNPIGATKSVHVSRTGADNNYEDEEEEETGKYGVQKIRASSMRSKTGWDTTNAHEPEDTPENDDESDTDDHSGGRVLADLHSSNNNTSGDFDRSARRRAADDYDDIHEVEDSFESELNISNSSIPGQQAQGQQQPAQSLFGRSASGPRSFLATSANVSGNNNNNDQSDNLGALDESVDHHDDDDEDENDELMVSRRSNQEEEEDYVLRQSKENPTVATTTTASWGQRVAPKSSEQDNKSDEQHHDHDRDGYDDDAYEDEDFEAAEKSEPVAAPAPAKATSSAVPATNLVHKKPAPVYDDEEEIEEVESDVPEEDDLSLGDQVKRAHTQVKLLQIYHIGCVLLCSYPMAATVSMAKDAAVRHTSHPHPKPHRTRPPALTGIEEAQIPRAEATIRTAIPKMKMIAIRNLR
jgi:hypothetical protein